MALSLDVLRLRDFRCLLLARMFGVLALQAQAIIVGWQIYSITHDPFMLGLAGLAEAGPAICSAFFSGHIVDNSRPHRIYMLCLGVLVCNTLMLLLVGGSIVTEEGMHILPWLYAGVFISGLARSFIMPSAFVLLPQIVERAKISSAAAWLSSSFQIAQITGPAAAGLIYGGYGPRVAWSLVFGSMVLSLVALAVMSLHPRTFRNAATREPVGQSIKAGWRFIWHNQVLLSVMALDMFAVLFGGAISMLPAYADQVLHVGSEGLGILRASPAIGAIGMGLFLALSPMKVVHARRLLWAVFGFGVSMVGFGLSTVFWASALFLVLSGLFDSFSMVTRQTLMQLLTPDSMRGRVSSVNSMFIISSNEIGAFESGVAAKLLGLIPSVVLGGIGSIIVVGMTALLAPRLRTLKVRPEDLVS